MTERLTVEHVIGINELECADTEEASNLLDPGGLAAAVERPWSGFGEFEAFPTLYDKAAALMHGIAARQVFENGNKRTAWVAATTLLEVNGIDIGFVDTVQADMFVRAAALDHVLEISDLAEWFEVAHLRRKAGYATDPRLEYLLLAEGSAFQETGVLDAWGMHLHGVTPSSFPTNVRPCVISRVHWRARDLGSPHVLAIKIKQTKRVAVVYGRDRRHTLVQPGVGGHEHHVDQIIPTIVAHHFDMSIVGEGVAHIVVEIDDVEVGRIPIMVTLAPDIDPSGLLS